jgi:hypothetical protein
MMYAYTEVLIYKSPFERRGRGWRTWQMPRSGVLPLRLCTRGAHLDSEKNLAKPTYHGHQGAHRARYRQEESRCRSGLSKAKI